MVFLSNYESIFIFQIKQLYFRLVAIHLFLSFELLFLLLQHLADLHGTLGLSLLIVGIVVVHKLYLLTYHLHLRLNSFRLALFAGGVPP